VGGGVLAYFRGTIGFSQEKCSCCNSDGTLGRYTKTEGSAELFVSAGAGWDVDVGDIRVGDYYLDLAFHFSISTIGESYTLSGEYLNDECDNINTGPVTLCWEPRLDMGVESVGVGNDNLGVFAQAVASFRGKFCVKIDSSGISALTPEGAIDARVSAWAMLAGRRFGLDAGNRFNWNDF
jgi:hypothetical protein